MVSYKAMFSAVPVNSVCLFGSVKVKKTSNIQTKGKPLSRCATNCVSLHNGHKCVIGDKAVVEVLEGENLCSIEN